MSIRIFITGATAAEISAEGYQPGPVEITKLPMRPGGVIDTEYRAKIARACVYTTEFQIVIVHGGDGLKETMKVIAGKPGLGSKTMVFCDADDVKEMIEQIRTLDAGAYVFANGECVSWKSFSERSMERAV